MWRDCDAPNEIDYYIFFQFESDYEKIVDILYLDAKDEYLTGRYLVDDVDVALELAALQLLIEEGPFEESKSKEDESVLNLVQ